MWLPEFHVKTHLSGSKNRCAFIAYLLKIITSTIKVITIIVSAIMPNRSKYMISNKAVSIISTTSPSTTYRCDFEVATTSVYHHLLYDIFYNVIFLFVNIFSSTFSDKSLFFFRKSQNKKIFNDNNQFSHCPYVLFFPKYPQSYATQVMHILL